MRRMEDYSIWLATGSQHLYGPKALTEVGRHAETIADALDKDPAIPVRVVFKPVVTTPEEIGALCREADGDPACAGLVCWMHTFSPAKMWIGGLAALRKPLCHLHTQFNRDIPWERIDMDFMNLNQSAHGDREFGHICARLRRARTVITGHWEEPAVRSRLGVWARAAAAFADLRALKVVRFGDNMRQVAVTEGDKVEAERVFGFSVNTHGVGDLAALIGRQKNTAVERLCR